MDSKTENVQVVTLVCLHRSAKHDLLCTSRPKGVPRLLTFRHGQTPLPPCVLSNLVELISYGEMIFRLKLNMQNLCPLSSCGVRSVEPVL